MRSPFCPSSPSARRDRQAGWRDADRVSIHRGTTFRGTPGRRNGLNHSSATSGHRAEHLTVERKTGLDSDRVLQQLAAGLRELGFAVESGKTASERIRGPVLFGSNGHAEVSHEIDAFHDGHGIVVEVEAGRGARGNATYRDIIRTSLIVDATYLRCCCQSHTATSAAAGKSRSGAYKEALPDLLSAYSAGFPTALPWSVASRLLSPGPVRKAVRDAALILYPTF